MKKIKEEITKELNDSSFKAAEGNSLEENMQEYEELKRKIKQHILNKQAEPEISEKEKEEKEKKEKELKKAKEERIKKKEEEIKKKAEEVTNKMKRKTAVGELENKGFFEKFLFYFKRFLFCILSHILL
jgi:hypothetical protein